MNVNFQRPQEINDDVFEMVKAAVNVARDGGFKTVASLKARLHCIFPSRQSDIEAAIEVWRAYVIKSNPNGIEK